MQTERAGCVLLTHCGTRRRRQGSPAQNAATRAALLYLLRSQKRSAPRPAFATPKAPNFRAAVISKDSGGERHRLIARSPTPFAVNIVVEEAPDAADDPGAQPRRDADGVSRDPNHSDGKQHAQAKGNVSAQ